MPGNTAVHDLRLNRYSMKSDARPKVGRVAIFNNTTFQDKQLPDRPGSNKDAKDIAAVFTEYGFEVDDIYQDYSSVEAGAKLEHIVETEDLSQHNSFICVFLSHREGDKISMRKGVLHIQDNILERFRKCQQLAGRPKVFIFQACRDNKNKGEKDITSQKEQKLNVQPSKDNRDKAKVDKEVENPQTTPASADFLECYATAHGCVTFRNRNEDSQFIQIIVKVLRAYKDNKNQPEMDLVSLLTKAAELVWEQRVAEVDQDDEKLRKLQIPCMVSTLKKQIFLPRE